MYMNPRTRPTKCVFEYSISFKGTECHDPNYVLYRSVSHLIMSGEQLEQAFQLFYAQCSGVSGFDKLNDLLVRLAELLQEYVHIHGFLRVK